MALRNPARDKVIRFKGLNSYDEKENLTYEWWSDSMNVFVNARGAAEVLRSPKALNASVRSGHPVISMADYPSSSTHKLLFDIIQDEVSESSDGEGAEGAEHDNVTTFTISDDLTNNPIRKDQWNYPFVSVIANGKLIRTNQKEIIQYLEDAVTVRPVGISAPAAAPTISYSGATGVTIDSGIQLSYAYMDSNRQHVGRPSPVSNRLGASSGTQDIHIGVVASTAAGVDKVVFFATLDGGDELFLLQDTNGDPLTASNSTTTVSITALSYDTLTPEPIYNFPPPVGARYAFVWLDRTYLLNFVSGSDVKSSSAIYSGNESVYIGQNCESYPVLNLVSCPNRGEVLRCGIGTQVGALFLSDTDAYLLGGYPPDKTQGPEATTAVSEHLEPLHWSFGTQSPRTLVNTPYGTMWLDQAAQIRKWSNEAIPPDAAVPLRDELSNIDRTKLDQCTATWFQLGRNGGYYVLTAPLTSGDQGMFVVMLYQDPQTNELQVAYAISDIQAYCLQPVRIFSDIRLLYGGIDRTFSILDASKEGDGWPNNTELFFESIYGNDDNFRKFHSLRFDGDVRGLTITIRDYNENINLARTITIEQDDDTGTSWFGLIDEYGHRKIIRFSFTDSDDSGESSEVETSGSSDSDGDLASPRLIKNLQVIYGKTKRVI